MREGRESELGLVGPTSLLSSEGKTAFWEVTLF